MMLGWRRRKDGFEWHKYVRTTILVRREQRRQRVEGMRQAAADGLKGAHQAASEHLAHAGQAAAGGLRAAGSKSAELGLAGLQSASRGATAGLGALFALPGRIGTTVGPILANLAARTGDLIAPAAPWLTATAVSVPLAVIAVAAGIAGVGRSISFGIDHDAAMALILAAVTLVLLIAPRLALRHRERPDETHPANSARGGPIGRMALPVIGGTMAAAALAVAGWGLWHVLNPAAAPASGVRQPVERRAAASDVTGRALALSGDRIRIGATVVRLEGIEAPDRNQTCKRANGRRWSCGTEAYRALGRLVRGKRVACTLEGTDDSGAALASCTFDSKDLAAELVRAGNVFAITGLFAPYSGLEAEAREARAGIWQGEALRPGEYRARLWDEAKQKAPDGCPIKGQVSRAGRTYVLPWSDRYQSIRVSERRGERWFCSEAEAQAAGWKPQNAS